MIPGISSGQLHYEIGYVTDAGNVRRDNQDSLLIRKGNIRKDEFALLAVADGMGGFARGEDASLQAVDQLDQWWRSQLSGLLFAGLDWVRLRNSLVVAVENINWSLYSKYSHMQNGKDRAGTTLTLAFLYQRQYLILQVGDSRAYAVKGGMLLPLTKDQTWCRREIEAGRLTEQEAQTHPMRHVLISTLGVTSDYELDEYKGKLNEGVGLLLCSDGFYGEMDNHLPDSFSKNTPVQTILDEAAARIRKGKAQDNLSAILLRVTKAHGKGM